MNKFLFIFPGQGSQYTGMGKDIFLEIPVVRETYEEASDILKYDLAKLSFDDPEKKLFLTRYTQPALLTHSIACLKSLEIETNGLYSDCLLYTSPSPRDGLLSRMPSSA